MKLSTFVSAMGWVSIYGMSWLMLTNRIEFDTTWWFFFMFWVVALAGGVISLVDVENRKPPMR